MITNDYQSDMPPFLLPMADKAPNQAHRDAEDDGSRDASRLSGALPGEKMVEFTSKNLDFTSQSVDFAKDFMVIFTAKKCISPHVKHLYLWIMPF